MAKSKRKQKRPKRPRGWLVDLKQVNAWIDDVLRFLAAQETERAIKTCRRILRYVPADSDVAVDALGLMGNAYAMERSFEQSYQALGQALALDPARADLWYNRGQSALFSSRSGQALLDFRQAVALEEDATLRAQYEKKRQFAEKAAEDHRQMGGPDFTLDDLITQEERQREAVMLMEEERYDEAEEALREVIAMGDRLPQPWGNLGVAHLVRGDYDEAEQAFRHALSLDPNYEIAKSNLALLPRLRAGGVRPIVTMHDPVQEANVNVRPHFAD